MSDWFYISFAGEDEFLGGLYIEGQDEEDAWFRASSAGLNPGGEAAIAGPIPPEMLDANVPPEDRRRLLTKAEVNP